MNRIWMGLILGVGLLLIVVAATLRYMERPSHIHFTTRDGALRQVIYYSETPPEPPGSHECDGSFAEMPEFLFETHLERWKEQYWKPGSAE